ncbi:MAG: plasmid pRiA4b ORF-3 family protein [Candidatus Binatia bacterium]
MTAQAPAASSRIYQIKVSLVGISPLIWRRLLVPDTTSIAELHYILQIAMGWEDYHLHRFQIYAKDYGISQMGGMGFSDNPWTVRLVDFGFRVHDRFTYEYDFGDNWEHDLRIEAILDPAPKKTYPICSDGKRACPPEDCGGAWQYIGILIDLWTIIARWRRRAIWMSLMRS